MSEPIQAIATNNYLLATPIGSGYMETSALEYDGDKISGYAGSAFKAGDEFPQSATDAIEYVTATSGDINSTIDNVSSNSGVWGGSALPISAGPGIKFDMVNGTLVASTDETVLWSGSWKPGNTTSPTNSAIQISESVNNFQYIKVITEGILCQTIEMTPNACQALICYPESDDRTSILGLKVSKDDDTHIRFRCGYSTNFIQAYRDGSDWGYFTLKKILGINRIAGGN